MKILFLSDAKSYHTQRWVNYFVERGHQCFLITLDRGFDTKAEDIFVPAKILPNFLKYPFSLRRIKKIAKEIKPDLVNAHFVPNYGLVGALLKIRPLVISTWGSDVLISPEKSWLHKKRAEYVLRKADIVTTDAVVTAEALHKLSVERGKVVVSPMGLERNLLGRPGKSKFGSTGKEKTYLLILSNRRLEPLYDIETLFKAIPGVISKAKKNVKFVILGEGSEKDKLIHLARELKIERLVEFKGVVSRELLLQYYKDSDIYVSTSKSDSTSVSLLEAMNFGLIPIVTDIPGNREWIEDQKNGFLFNMSDPEALSDKIIYVINEFAQKTEFRKKNEDIIRNKAVWEDNMKVIEERFDKLIRTY